jgi:hypothetical protein
VPETPEVTAGVIVIVPGFWSAISAAVKSADSKPGGPDSGPITV